MKKVLIIVAVVIVIIIILMVVMKKKQATTTTDAASSGTSSAAEMAAKLLDPTADPNYCRKTCDSLCKPMPVIAFGKKRSRAECERDCRSDCTKKMDVSALYPK